MLIAAATAGLIVCMCVALGGFLYYKNTKRQLSDEKVVGVPMSTQV